MAMLAGPRRKQKVINLRAKNNAWSNDTNKFGQRMLEKMGWSSGKGLGAKENGIVEHVVARFKNDEKGLGFEDKNDQWTKHEDDFNSLLANLSNADDKKEILHSGVSLEVKSKKSKARIHYHKFTRGKDLSRYSEKDLANIFGKKSFNKEAEEEEFLKNDVQQNTEQIFTEKGNMDDYFKFKMAAFKSKSKSLVLNNTESTEDISDYAFKGFSNNEENPNEEDSTNSKCQEFSFYTSSKSDSNENEPQLNVDENIKKKKKSKNKDKMLKMESQTSENLDYQDNLNNPNEINPIIKKSKKKVKHCDNNDIDPIIKKKSKKKKFEEPTENELQECTQNSKKKKDKLCEEDKQKEDQLCVEEYIPKKKKKRKNKDL